MTHTPEPWEQSGNHIVARDADGRITKNGKSSIAKVFGPDKEANAALIVKAPDLLECLKNEVPQLANLAMMVDPQLTAELMEVVYSLIAAATERQPA